MSKFFMMVGLPASGKSTQANLIHNISGAGIVSTDTLRAEILGDINSQDNKDVIFDMAHSFIIADLHKGNSVIFDATNLTVRNRMLLLEKIKFIPNVEKCAIVMDVPLGLCKERNQKRDRQVPDEVLERMDRQFTRYQFPSFAEGWDTIITISKREDKQDGRD